MSIPYLGSEWTRDTKPLTCQDSVLAEYLRYVPRWVSLEVNTLTLLYKYLPITWAVSASGHPYLMTRCSIPIRHQYSGFEIRSGMGSQKGCYDATYIYSPGVKEWLSCLGARENANLGNSLQEGYTGLTTSHFFLVTLLPHREGEEGRVLRRPSAA